MKSSDLRYAIVGGKRQKRFLWRSFEVEEWYVVSNVGTRLGPFNSVNAAFEVIQRLEHQHAEKARAQGQRPESAGIPVFDYRSSGDAFKADDVVYLGVDWGKDRNFSVVLPRLHDGAQDAEPSVGVDGAAGDGRNNGGGSDDVGGRPGERSQTNATADQREEATMTKYIDIICEGSPGSEGAKFVEVHDDQGRSVRAGDWERCEEGDGYWRLRVEPSVFGVPPSKEPVAASSQPASAPDEKLRGRVYAYIVSSGEFFWGGEGRIYSLEKCPSCGASPHLYPCLEQGCPYAAPAQPAPAVDRRGRAMSELDEAISLVRTGAGRRGYRSYSGGGEIWAGNNEQYADARFVDWGLARATAIILNAVARGELIPKPSIEDAGKDAELVRELRDPLTSLLRLARNSGAAPQTLNDVTEAWAKVTGEWL